MGDYTLENINRLKILQKDFPVQEHIVTLDPQAWNNNDSILRKQAVELDVSRLREGAMRTTMLKMAAVLERTGGVGLSATQVGIPQKFFIMKVKEHNPARKRYPIPLRMVMNCNVLMYSEEQNIMIDACLSVPGYACLVERPVAMLVHYYTLGRNGFEEKLHWVYDYEAQIFDHEGDHSDGTLIYEKAIHPDTVLPVADYKKYLAMNMDPTKELMRKIFGNDYMDILKQARSMKYEPMGTAHPEWRSAREDWERV